MVAGASYESRVFGARSATPMHQARRMVGAAAVVLPPRGVVYGVASRRVFDTVRPFVPVLEQLLFDEAFGEPVELAGASVDDVEAFCRTLKSKVLDVTGLVASVGAGIGQAGRQDRLGPGETRRHPGGLPHRRTGAARRVAGAPAVGHIGPVAEEKLHRLGIDTIGAFAALSDAEAVNILGGTVGAALHRLACGIDERPVAEQFARQADQRRIDVSDLSRRPRQCVSPSGR